MSVEIIPVQRWLIQRLDAALAIPVVELPAPADTPYPFCAVDVTPYPYRTNLQGSTIFSVQEWIWRIVGQGSVSALEAYVAQANAATRIGKNVAITGGYSIDSYHAIEPFRPPPYFVNGVRTQEIGSRIRVLVRKTS